MRFENKINLEMWGSFEILESYVGETVKKIRFVGNIKREILGEFVSTYVLVKKGEKPEKGRRGKRAAISAILR